MQMRKQFPNILILKNKLNANYTWTKINKAKQHFDLNSPEIKIKITAYERICAKIAITSFIILILVGVILFSYLNQFKIQGIRDFLLVLSSLIVPAIIGYSFIIAVESILIAKQMEKRLESLQ